MGWISISGMAQADDHSNTFDGATAILADDVGNLDYPGNLEAPEDLDFFRFELTETSMVWLYTTGITNTVLVLYDASGKQLESDLGAGVGDNALIARTDSRRLLPGIYYVKVSGRTDVVTGAYTLSIRTQTNATDWSSPNYPGQLEIPGDLDLFRFEIVETTMLWLYTTGNTNTVLVLYDANGKQIESDLGAGAGDNALITRTDSRRLLPGTYYAKVSGRTDVVTGAYTLSIRTQTNAIPWNRADQRASLGVEGDLDLYRFEIRTQGPCYFFTTGKSNTSLLLYNSNGERLATTGLAAEGGNKAIRAMLKKGSYFLAVQGEGTGAYVVSKRVPGSATFLPSASKLKGSIKRYGERDYYVIPAKKGRISIKSSGPTPVAAALFKPNEANPIATSTPSVKDQDHFTLQANVKSGTYYLVVYGKDVKNDKGKYSLSARYSGRKTVLPGFDAWFVPESDGKFTLPVSANTKWQAKPGAGWMKLRPKAGNGDGKITVRYLRNNRSPRIGKIKVGPRKVEVLQSGIIASP